MRTDEPSVSECDAKMMASKSSGRLDSVHAQRLITYSRQSNSLQPNVTPPHVSYKQDKYTVGRHRGQGSNVRTRRRHILRGAFTRLHSCTTSPATSPFTKGGLRGFVVLHQRETPLAPLFQRGDTSTVPSPSFKKGGDHMLAHLPRLPRYKRGRHGGYPPLCERGARGV
jgi:hypothetical protein